MRSNLSHFSCSWTNLVRSFNKVDLKWDDSSHVWQLYWEHATLFCKSFEKPHLRAIPCDNAISSSIMLPRGRTLFRNIKGSVIKYANESKFPNRYYLLFWMHHAVIIYTTWQNFENFDKLNETLQEKNRTTFVSRCKFSISYLVWF